MVQMNKRKNRISTIADWITIVTGPISFISAFVAIVSYPSNPEIIIQGELNCRIVIFAIASMVNLIFFLEVSFRLARLINDNNIAYLPENVICLLFSILGLSIFLSIQLIIFNRLFIGSLLSGNLFALFFIGHSLVWLIFNMVAYKIPLPE